MEAGDLFVERLIEPYIGLPLLGVGGYLPVSAVNDRIEVRYDDEIAAVITPQIIDGGLCHFSTQLPLESSRNRVSVKHGNRILFDDGIANIGQRPTPAVPERGVRAKLAASLNRSFYSVASGEVFSLWRWSARLERLSESLLKVRQKVRNKLLMWRHRPCSPHDAFVERTALSAEQIQSQTENARRFRHRPTISILMPVYEVEPRWFRAAVDSVLAQSYDRWELCIADDASSDVGLLAELDRLPDDSRIKLVRRQVNGHICAASNSAAEVATGEFIALLDNDDALAPDALYEVVKALNDNPATDLLYSDEDKIDAKEHRYDPQRKPGWSPELLLSYNYINHFTVIRRSVFERVGRFRLGYEGSQDHDLLLRITERTDRVVRIPRILYHWRALPSSTASTAGVKSYVHSSGQRAVEDALARRGINASLTVPAFAQKLGLPVLALDAADDGPSVAIIVYGPADSASQTIRALESHKAYRNITVYLVLEADADSLNRMAAARSEDYLLFLAAGLVSQDERWLSRLLAYAQIPGVGAVGGTIRNADGSIRSAGTVISPDGLLNAFENLAPDAVSYYFYAEVARNVSAPGRGLLLTARRTFDRLGGFDADRFGETLFEIDFAARLRGSGLRCVHVGDAAFVAAEVLNRRLDVHEWHAFRIAHGMTDPFSNPHFSEREPFRISGDAGLIPATPARPLRAVIAAHNLNSPEGAPRYLSEIVLGLRGRGVIEPSVISPLDGAGAAIYRDEKVPLAILEGAWSKRFIDLEWSPRSYETAQQTLMETLWNERPEVVIANTLLTFPVVEAAARLGIPSLWIIHESYSAEVLARFFTPYAQQRCEAAFALATRIVPASHDTAALFRRCDTRHTIRVIHNGIDPSPIDAYCRRVSKAEARVELGLDPRKVHVIAVGTVCERKGQHTLVEAAASLGQKRRDFGCHLVGVRDAVPYAGYVCQLVQRRGVGDLVNLVGETNGVSAWYRAADAFVCTSHMEAFSRAILEAEAFGLPILSTPCHGLGEQVKWGENALMFPFHDAAKLAEHLDALINDAGLRRAMGAKSRAVFDTHATFDEMLDRYQAAIQGAAKSLETEAVPAYSLRTAA